MQTTDTYKSGKESSELQISCRLLPSSSGRVRLESQENHATGCLDMTEKMLKAALNIKQKNKAYIIKPGL